MCNINRYEFIHPLKDLEIANIIDSDYFHNKNLFKMLDSCGYKFTEQQFSTLFFSRRNGKSVLNYYLMIFDVVSFLAQNTDEEYKEISFNVSNNVGLDNYKRFEAFILDNLELMDYLIHKTEERGKVLFFRNLNTECGWEFWHEVEKEYYGRVNWYRVGENNKNKIKEKK